MVLGMIRAKWSILERTVISSEWISYDWAVARVELRGRNKGLSALVPIDLYFMMKSAYLHDLLFCYFIYLNLQRKSELILLLYTFCSTASLPFLQFTSISPSPDYCPCFDFSSSFKADFLSPLVWSSSHSERLPYVILFPAALQLIFTFPAFSFCWVPSFNQFPPEVFSYFWE